MKKIRKLFVSKKEQICPNLLRITLTGQDLIDFPEQEKGGYVKLMFPNLSSNDQSYLHRPYTIRNFCKTNLELVIDFANHKGNKGLATHWAQNTNLGDNILISGPGPKQNIPQNADWILFIGDMSALPAISTYLEDLDQNTEGIAVIEVLEEKDKISLKKPQNFEIYWITNSSGFPKDSKLFEKVSSFEFLQGNPYIWVACEFNNMKKIRNYFQNQKKIDRNFMYVSSYWKAGLDQEAHKMMKKADAINWKG